VLRERLGRHDEAFRNARRIADACTLDLASMITHLDAPACAGQIRLDRFSPNFERAAEIGFRNVTPMPAYGAIYDVPDDELAQLAGSRQCWTP